MAALEGRLLAAEEFVIGPAVKRLPAEWRVQVIRAGFGAAFEVRVVIPKAGEHSKTFAPNAGGEDIVTFLEWVRAHPEPAK